MHAKQYLMAVRLWREGWAGKVIARAVGISEKAMFATACNHREDFPRRYNASTTEQRAEAVRLRGEGWTVQAIADKLGAHPETVRRWCKRGAGVARAEVVR